MALVCGCALLGACALPLPALPSEGEITAIALERWASYGDMSAEKYQVLLLRPDGVMERYVLDMEQAGELPVLDAEAAPPPAETRRAPAEAFEQAARLVAEGGFLRLPDKIEANVLDGSYQYITVAMGEAVARKGGLVASEASEAFGALYEALWQAWDEAEGETPAKGPWEMGNTPGNYACGVGALERAGEAWVTLTSLDEKSLVRLAAGGVPEPLNLPGAEQALGGWLYYSAWGAGGGSIHRVRPDGSGEEMLLSGRRISGWQLAGDYLYVLEQQDLGVESYIPVYSLWRRPIEGGPEQEYSFGNVSAFALSEQYIFVASEESPGLVRAGLDGGDARGLDISAVNFFYAEGWLYYSTDENEWNQLWRCREDGSDKELLVRQADGDFNLEEDWLYYNRRLTPADRDDRYPDSVLERLNLQTGEVQLLDGEPRLRRGISLAGEWVVFGTTAVDETYGVPVGLARWALPKTGGEAVQLLWEQAAAPTANHQD